MLFVTHANKVLFTQVGFQFQMDYHHAFPYPTPVLLPEKPYGQRSLVGYSPWGRKESDTTEPLHFTSQVALVIKNLPASAGDVGSIPGLGRSPGEGNGNPLQYPCLENSWRILWTEESGGL